VGPVVLIDARNVLRSRWPNIPERELVARSVAWADAEEVRAVLVFDGGAPEVDVEPHEVVGTGAESADDWIARRAGELADAAEPYWLVTSDRELRERAAHGAMRTIGGGSFAGMLAD
jgi:hypothetical protein